jgi:hypothetical protein
MHVWDTRTSWPPDEPDPAIPALDGDGKAVGPVPEEAAPGRIDRIRARLPGKR